MSLNKNYFILSILYCVIGGLKSEQNYTNPFDNIGKKCLAKNDFNLSLSETCLNTNVHSCFSDENSTTQFPDYKTSSKPIYNCFLDLLSQFSIEEIAEVLHMSVEQLNLVISCYASQSNHVTSDEQMSLSFYEKLFNIALISLLVMVSLLGNSLLLITLNPFRELRLFECIRLSRKRGSLNAKNSANLASANLNCTSQSLHGDLSVRVMDVFFWNSAIFDLLWTMIVAPSQMLIIIYDGHWIFDAIACKIYGYSTYLLLTINSLTIVAISLDRFFKIIVHDGNMSKCRSDKAHRASKKTYLCLVLIIIVSFLINLPYLIYSDLFYIVKGSTCLEITTKRMCLNIWQENTLAENVYKIAFIALIYLLPGFILLFTYAAISSYLVWKQCPNLSTERCRSKMKIVKLLILDCLFYILCWFPLSIWVLFSCMNNIFDWARVSMHMTYNYFIYLYIGPIANVSLKWIFRVTGSWPRIKALFRRFILNKRTANSNQISPANSMNVHVTCKKASEFSKNLNNK